MGTFVRLETPRLILREIVPEDSEAIFAIRSDREVTWLNIGAPYTELAQAERLIAQIHDDWLAGTALRWGITLRTEDRVIGMCGFNYWVRADNRAAVGYDLLRSVWGRGLMSEALGAVLAFGFEAMQLNRIEADTSAENTASIRLLKKLGFSLEGCQREQYFQEDRYYDLLLFGLLKREFRQPELLRQ